jgi:type II secretory pathway pseudopilin PulG
MKRGRPSRSGATLVEVIMACLILGILAIAATESIRYSKSMTITQRNRRTATDIANGRLEDVRSVSYTNVASGTVNGTVRYLRRNASSWSILNSDPGETVVVNGRTRPIVTTVQYIDADGGATSYDCLRILVRVNVTASGDGRCTCGWRP